MMNDKKNVFVLFSEFLGVVESFNQLIHLKHWFIKQWNRSVNKWVTE